MKSLRVESKTKEESDRIISSIHILAGKKLTQTEYVEEANSLMIKKYKIKK